MHDQISVTGHVGTVPKHLTTPNGLTITSFRLGSTPRRFDRESNAWVDGDTNWYTVNTYRHLARNVAASVERGQSVVVSGRLRVRSWEKDDRHGLTIEIDADAVGHDLTWGTSSFIRMKGGTPVSRAEDTFSEIESQAAAAGLDGDPAVADEDTAEAAVPF